MTVAKTPSSRIRLGGRYGRLSARYEAPACTSEQCGDALMEMDTGTGTPFCRAWRRHNCATPGVRPNGLLLQHVLVLLTFDLLSLRWLLFGM
jgi:hypothetical protein